MTLAWPFMFAAIPPLTDYPNHLAGFWLIAGGANDPALAPFYAIDWRAAVTNVGVDRAVALLSPFLPAFKIGWLAAVASAVLPPIGILALNLAIFRRLSTLSALFPLAAWSTTFLMGFLNFQIGLGLALLFAAVDPLVQPRWSRAAAFMRIPLGLILGADHLFALGFYTALLAGLGLGRRGFTFGSWAEFRRSVHRAAAPAAWCLAPLVAIGAHPESLPGAQRLTQTEDPITFANLVIDKLATLFSPLASYNVLEELLIGIAVTILLLWLRRRRALRTHGGLLFASVVMVAIAVFAPSHLSGASWIDRRVPIMALICLFAGVQLHALAPPRLALGAGYVALSLSAAQAAWIAWNWRALDGDLRQVERALSDVPAGARLLPLQHVTSYADRLSAPAGRYIYGVGDATFRHYHTLAVPLRRAFVPNLFSARGLQPVEVKGPWDAIVEHNGADLASVATLTREPRKGDPSYIPGWRSRFDYVLVLNADMADKDGPFRPPAELTLVTRQPFVELWRVGESGSRAP